MSSYEPRYPTSGITLKTCVEELRGSCEAIARVQGGTTYYREEIEIFRTYAEEKQLFFQSEPIELGRPPDDEGNEHQVWFNSKSSTYLKATWHDFYGMIFMACLSYTETMRNQKHHQSIIWSAGNFTTSYSETA